MAAGSSDNDRAQPQPGGGHCRRTDRRRHTRSFDAPRSGLSRGPVHPAQGLSIWRSSSGRITPPTALIRAMHLLQHSARRQPFDKRRVEATRPHTLLSRQSEIISPFTPRVLTRSKNDQRPDHPSLSRLRFWPSQPRGGEGPEVARQRRDAGCHPGARHQGCSGHTSAQSVHASSKMSYTQSTFV
jgi:hypothetical protein